MLYTFHTGKCFQMTVPGGDMGKTLGGRCRRCHNRSRGIGAPEGGGSPRRRRSARVKEVFSAAKEALSDLIPNITKIEESPEKA